MHVMVPLQEVIAHGSLILGEAVLALYTVYIELTWKSGLEPARVVHAAQD